jgi:hypothetical protein
MPEDLKVMTTEKTELFGCLLTKSYRGYYWVYGPRVPSPHVYQPKFGYRAKHDEV